MRPWETLYLDCNAAGQLKSILLVVSVNSSKFHVPKYFLDYITSQQDLE